jgi:hypothetical protein
VWQLRNGEHNLTVDCLNTALFMLSPLQRMPKCNGQQLERAVRDRHLGISIGKQPAIGAMVTFEPARSVMSSGNRGAVALRYHPQGLPLMSCTNGRRN